MKPWLANVLLVLVSVIAGLLLGEAGARVFLNPSDYLSAPLKKDDILGGVIEPGAGGFDAWGYRNRSVPERVDIVALGDSHTYGNTAGMEESWPHVAGVLTGRSVYNMGMGGYGPNQYYHLMTARALGLRPAVVLCGLYLGDDFENAFAMSYGVEHWSYLRQRQFGTIDADIWREPQDDRVLKDLRVWLSRNSVLYQIVVHGPVTGRLKGYIQLSRAAREPDPSTTTLTAENGTIREAFRPAGIRDRLDLGRKEIREGLRITKRLLQDMNGACVANGCRFVVVVIPTKEMVFASNLEREPSIHLRRAIDELLAGERAIRKDLFGYFQDAGIRYIDTLPALERATGQGLYVRSDRDMHPGRNGYRVIAEAVADYLGRSGILDGRGDGAAGSAPSEPNNNREGAS
jgi:hypothetical protein